ncbi:MAG: IS1634 family transposase, partial [Candidatus Helarchaeota archaeon]
GDVPPWDDIIRDLRAFQAVKLAIDGKEFLVRSDFEGVTYRCFMAAGVKPPPQIRKM